MLFDIVRQSKRVVDIENKPCTKAQWNGDNWQIILSSIEDLNDLIDEVGDIVIEKDYIGVNTREITIYDDNIE
jgi:hypothetical protein